MPGSLGRFSGPPANTTNRALSTSPRSVVTCQRDASATHCMLVIVVWNSADR
jgi:hypothetical protein